MVPYRRILESLADEGYREFTSSLIPGKEGILGVRVPDIHRLAKTIIDEDWRSFLDEAPSCFEEEMLEAEVIASAPMDVDERIRYTEEFIGTMDNWSVCDLFCSRWSFDVTESDQVWTYFRGLMGSGMEYPMRASMVLRSMRFRDADHIRDIVGDARSFDHAGYYYRMGCAWSLCECFVYDREDVLNLLEQGGLPIWTHNKTIQKIVESRRTSKEDRELVRSLRRKRSSG
ncbi:MAG: DNA alkylation repair protein [Candidatus Methanomethylophilaceae archaeon]|nr:DNA alkylation repair protein [Candidatus Methanomethylophilaceae archaeon]